MSKSPSTHLPFFFKDKLNKAQMFLGHVCGRYVHVSPALPDGAVHPGWFHFMRTLTPPAGKQTFWSEEQQSSLRLISLTVESVLLSVRGAP